MRGVFVHSWRLTGMENYIRSCTRIPDSSIAFRRWALTQYNLKQLEMLAAAGIDVLVVEDDIAHNKQPPHIPEDFYGVC